MTDQAQRIQSQGWSPHTGIEVTDLAFSYPGKTVFSDVNFHVPAGQVYGLIGRSGIGKSTLLNVILGLFRPTNGTVSIRDGATVRPGQIRGVVFQEESLLGWLTTLQNVTQFHPHRHESDTSKQAQDLLRAAGLAGTENVHPKQLSTGMRKRAELVRALLTDNEFFVADEPFTALDVQTRTEIYDVWMKLRASYPRTGIICTHDPFEAVMLCDAIVVMNQRANRSATTSTVAIPAVAKTGPEKNFASDEFVATLVGMMK
jgi:ABC-type nitrate/sulfonate/bicarbonate transport system ATPase subunit